MGLWKFIGKGNRTRLLLFFCGMQFLWMPVFSQARHLSKEPAEFAARLPLYMVSDPNLGKEDREYLEKALPLYLAFYEGIDLEVQEKVAEIASLSVKARLRPYPELWEFFQVQQALYEMYPLEQAEWFNALHGLLKKNRARYFSDLVRKTRAVVFEGCLYKSVAAHWKVSGGTFHFKSEPEPVFFFKQTDLSCRAFSDSTAIEGTSGTYYPMKDCFEGHGGRVFWTRAGFNPDSCWTDLLDYSLKLRQGQYEAEAYFCNKGLFQEPLYGTFSEHLSTTKDVSESRYPRFVSDQENLRIENIYPGMDIEGPFVQQGYRTYFGAEGRNASLKIRDKEGLRAVVSADRIVFGQERISIPEARIVIYLDQDSLYNPMVSVRFDNGNRVLHVGNMENVGFTSPYIDTYHQLRMDFEALRWYVDERRLEIGLLDVPGREGVVSFQSLAMYSRKELGQMMLGTDVNPLYLLSQMAKRGHSDEFSLQELAEYVRMSKPQALALIRNLIEYGYVTYDPSRQWITLLPRLRHTLQVTANKADFDELEFATTQKGIVKATMDMDSLVLKMSGVPYVLLSRKQNMYVRPSDSIVEIYKNRDFHFDGFLNAGTFNFEVQGGCFYYDDFKVDIADVRQLGLEVKVIENGKEVLRPVFAKIRYLAGRVYIDDPSNKGGAKDFPGYPLLESIQPSYVYYDEPYVQGGVYKADSFYFQIDPFRMPNLNTIDMDSIRFGGTLVSAGILPDLQDDLRVMPDFSLGFEQLSPEEGWPAYEGMASFSGKVTLDNSGLWGTGDFDYMASRSTSERMVLRPGDMDMYGSFSLEAGRGQNAEYPEMAGEWTHCEFEKHNGNFRTSSIKDSLLHVFGKEWNLQGTYEFSPVLSMAEGVFHKADEAHVGSDHFSVRAQGFSADTGSLRLGGIQGACFVESQGYALDVDLLQRVGSFHAVDGRAPAVFGWNQYEGHVSSMHWDMDNGNVEMVHEGLAGIPWNAMDSLTAAEMFHATQPGEYFVSTRRAQDSLGFYAMSSELSCRDTMLHFSGVCRLLVADAMFRPSGHLLTVSKTGMLLPLVGARLYFGDSTRLHAFHDVSANVLSSKQYRASGIFDYKAPDMDLQGIRFAGIRPVKGGHSMAEARLLADSSVLWLNEAFQYIGKITVDARQTFPFFSGSARMVYACAFPGPGERMQMEEKSDYDDFEYEVEEEGYDDFEYEDESPAEIIEEEGYDDFEYEDEGKREKSRKGKHGQAQEETLVPAPESIGLKEGNPFLADGIQFEAYVNPDSVRIPVDSRTRSTTGRLLGRGFYTQTRSREPMLLFLQRKLVSDMPDIELSGWLGFSKAARSYQITDSIGQVVMNLDLKSCLATATGNIDLLLNTYSLETRFYGKMTQDASSGLISVEALSMFDFYLCPEVCKKMAALLNEENVPEGLEIKPSDWVVKYLEQNIPDKEMRVLREDLELTGVFGHIPFELAQSSIVFPDMVLKWDSEERSFVSQGKTALLSLGGYPVNKMMKTYVCMEKTRRGDRIDIYMEAGRNTWIYFSYTNNYMQVLTSDEGLNQFIGDLRGSKRKNGRYEFFLASLSKKNTFVRNFEEQWGERNQY